MADGNSARKRPTADLVDCERASRGVWLVKVPRYLSEIWEKNEGSDVGRLVQLSADVVKLISTTPDETSAVGVCTILCFPMGHFRYTLDITQFEWIDRSSRCIFSSPELAKSSRCQ